MKAARLLILFLVACGFSAPGQSSAQIRIDTTVSVQKMVDEILLGREVKASNATLRGYKHAIAAFTNDGVPIGMENGLVLSTGLPWTLPGPNNQPDITKYLVKEGDPLLKNIARGVTYDAVVLEFDFVPASDSIYFNYLFASEEYPEFVGSSYNDVFAFHIRGPGIKTYTNIAVLPGSSRPVTVNSINHLKFKDYYIDNNPFDKVGKFWQIKADKLNPKLLNGCQMDGFTAVLTARSRVIPGQTYHIRIGIADVSDGKFDSVVMLQGKSFSSAPNLESYLTMAPQVSENIRSKMFFSRNDTLPSAPAGHVTPETALSSALAKTALFSDTVFFDFDSHTLNRETQNTLSALIKKIMEKPGRVIKVVGFTDSRGSDVYNDSLSRRRTEAIRDYLISKGVPASRMQLLWEGESHPAANNKSEKGRALNRRVELYLMREGE